MENIGYTRQIAVTYVKNSSCVNYDFKVGDKILIRKDGILRKAEFIRKNPWTITTVQTNETIRIQCGTKSERINTQSGE